MIDPAPVWSVASAEGVRLKLADGWELIDGKTHIETALVHRLAQRALRVRPRVFSSCGRLTTCAT